MNRSAALTPALPLHLPRGPVLAWRTWQGAHHAGVPALDDLPHQCPTSSGRAAIALALKALQLPAGSTVLLPSYHCPTMPAAVVHAGLRPVFHAQAEDLSPQWPALDALLPLKPAALLAAHYFGQGRSLARERAWCTQHGVALIEDCAHAWFGLAGEQPVGTWGDYAIGSATKFFPVREGGLLASAHRPCPRPDETLQANAWGAEVRTALGLLAQSHRLGRLAPLSTLPGWLEAALARAAQGAQNSTAAPTAPLTAPTPSCDMARMQQRPWRSSEWLRRHVPRARIVQGRRQAASRLAQALEPSLQRGIRIWGSGSVQGVPYVLPLWVEDAATADAVYRQLRTQGLPVFRWDARWPGSTLVEPDAGQQAARHLLQLPTHPDYTLAELRHVAAVVVQALVHAKAELPHAS